MMLEIERKFLVANDLWRASARPAVRYRQGYLAKTLVSTTRVRWCGGATAELTVKSQRRGLARDEFTYPIPASEAEAMLQGLCDGRVLEKDRHLVDHDGMTWSIDVYRGAAEGLVVAEIELDDEDQRFSTPPWLGAEISHDPRYGNFSIAVNCASGVRSLYPPMTRLVSQLSVA